MIIAQEPDGHSEHSRRRSEESRRKSGGNDKEKHRHGGSAPVRYFGRPQHDCLNFQEDRRTELGSDDDRAGTRRSL